MVYRHAKCEILIGSFWRGFTLQKSKTIEVSLYSKSSEVRGTESNCSRYHAWKSSLTTLVTIPFHYMKNSSLNILQNVSFCVPQIILNTKKALYTFTDSCILSLYCRFKVKSILQRLMIQILHKGWTCSVSFQTKFFLSLVFIFFNYDQPPQPQSALFLNSVHYLPFLPLRWSFPCEKYTVLFYDAE